MMPGIRVLLDCDGSMPELVDKLKDGTAQWLRSGDDGSITVGVLSGGMTSGRPSVVLRIDGPDGKVVCCETSWRALRLACDAISARYGSGGD